MKKTGKKKKKIIPAALAVLICLILPGFYNALKVVHYEVRLNGITRPVRIALVTDLHSCAYGEGQRELLDAIEKETPDLVLLCGDIFDGTLPGENAALFLMGVGSRYPCYYVTGNQEYRGGRNSFDQRMSIIADSGVTRLSGEAVTAEVNGARISLCGVDDPLAWTGSLKEHTEGSFEEQLSSTAGQAENGAVTILLTHRPELMDAYSRMGFSLVLAGHAHGGQWRIPGIVNGLLAPNQGLFPAYAGGLYEKDDTVMIVSRGLARESTLVPRWYNRPELVIIDLAAADTKSAEIRESSGERFILQCAPGWDAAFEALAGSGGSAKWGEEMPEAVRSVFKTDPQLNSIDMKDGETVCFSFDRLPGKHAESGCYVFYQKDGDWRKNGDVPADLYLRDRYGAVEVEEGENTLKVTGIVSGRSGYIVITRVLPCWFTADGYWPT